MEFLPANGLLSFDGGKLTIHYDGYHQVVGQMLANAGGSVLRVTKLRPTRFIDKYATWDDNLQEQLRGHPGAAEYRFRLFKYAALGE